MNALTPWERIRQAGAAIHRPPLKSTTAARAKVAAKPVQVGFPSEALVFNDAVRCL